MENEIKIKNFEMMKHQAQWKTRRTVISQHYDEACAQISKECDERIAEEKKRYDEACAQINEERRHRMQQEKLVMLDLYEDVAKEQDAYEHEFRLYVATLPMSFREGERRLS